VIRAQKKYQVQLRECEKANVIVNCLDRTPSRRAMSQNALIFLCLGLKPFLRIKANNFTRYFLNEFSTSKTILCAVTALVSKYTNFYIHMYYVVSPNIR
jgi:hypothetical protein